MVSVKGQNMISAAIPSTNGRAGNHTDDLYLVLTSQRLRTGRTAATAMAHQRVVAVYLRTARGLLQAWHVPNADMEAEDAVQQWLLVMLEGGFERWDLEQSVHAFANKILRRICIAILKRHMRRRMLPLDAEQACDADDMVTAMVRAEDQASLQRAIAQLHPTLRREVECWLAEGFPRDLDAKSRRRRSRTLWRAKQRLRQLLMKGSEQQATKTPEVE